jgi:hypothetical protein
MHAFKFGALALVVLLLVAQAFRIDKTNPPVKADTNPPAPVKEVMTRSCYQCHSNETVWPWYSNVAPASWLVAYDVHEGRDELNFSAWGNYSQPQRIKKLKEIRKEIADGDMPPWYYIYPMHMDARLSAAERQAVDGWIASESEVLDQSAAQGAPRVR